MKDQDQKNPFSPNPYIDEVPSQVHYEFFVEVRLDKRTRIIRKHRKPTRRHMMKCMKYDHLSAYQIDDMCGTEYYKYPNLVKLTQKLSQRK